MPEKKSARRRKKRFIRRIFSLLLVAAAALAGWNYLMPLISDETIPIYAAYTARRGDIASFNSYRATLNVLRSETLSNSRQVTSVKKVYVQANQDVSEGDKLMQLENGEVLKAGIDGTVNQIRFGEGDWIWPNVSLIQICDLSNLQVSLSVDEYDIANVSVGETCYVTIVPLGLAFETRISHVDRVSSASSSVAYYSVTAELTVPENVLPGMTASVSIPAEKATGVVLLDMAALSFDEDDAPYVLVKSGDEYRRQAIETGLSDGMYIEIRSGLNEGDEVYRVSGEEKAVAAVSLADLYKRIAGETVVVRDRSESSGGRGFQRGGGFTQGMTAPEGMEMPEGFEMPGNMQRPESTAQPEATDSPESTEQPEATDSPENTEQPEASEAPGERKRPEGMTFPEGMEPPEGFEMPEGFEPPSGFEMPSGFELPGSSAPSSDASPARSNQP